MDKLDEAKDKINETIGRINEIAAFELMSEKKEEELMPDPDTSWKKEREKE